MTHIQRLVEPIILENNLITETNSSLNIYTNFDDFLSQWSKFIVSNGNITSQLNQSYNIVRTNSEPLYSSLFLKYSNLLLINSRGDGNCFNNSLFIFGVMAKSLDSKFLELFATAELDDFNININNFIQSQLILGDKYIDSKNMSPSRANTEKQEMRDPNTPEIYPFMHNFSNMFNCNILIISVDADSYQIQSKTYENPVNANNQSEHVVIIQKGRSHFQVLVLHNSTFEQRKQLYMDVFAFTERILGY